METNLTSNSIGNFMQLITYLYRYNRSILPIYGTITLNFDLTASRINSVK